MWLAVVQQYMGRLYEDVYQLFFNQMTTNVMSYFSVVEAVWFCSFL